MGDRPCGADATVFAFVAHWSGAGLRYARPNGGGNSIQNLVAYRDRILRHYFQRLGKEVPPSAATKLLLAG